jgi:hypothetical protein
MPMLDLLTTNILHTSLKNVLQTEPAQANPQISNTNLLMQAMLTDPRDAAVKIRLQKRSNVIISLGVCNQTELYQELEID